MGVFRSVAEVRVTSSLKVAVVSQRIVQWRSLLVQQSDLPVTWVFEDAPDFADAVQDCSILWGDTPEAARWLPDLPQVCWYHSFYSGIDALLPLRAQLPDGLVVTNSRDIAGPHIAEYVLGQILALTRQLDQYRQKQVQREWHWMDYRTLGDEKLLVLGVGAIGQIVAQRLAPWCAQIDGVSRSARSVPSFTQVHSWSETLAHLPQYRVVVNTLPFTPATDGLLDTRFFDRLASDAIFINVGRGATVQDEALLDALTAQPERRAVLDVFREEPLPADHPYWSHPGVVVTPHVAAQSQPQWVLPIVLDNLQRFLAGKPLRNRVDLELGY